MTKSISLFFKNFFRRETTARAIKVAVLVAPILIWINHFDLITAQKFTPVLYFKCLLTFLSLIAFPLFPLLRLIREKRPRIIVVIARI
jgi:hypothetical protein